jgi:tripartite-type tricarboxylate transporter receptor subunit TctC
MKIIFHRLLAALALPLIAASVQAADAAWPQRTIRIVVGAPAGSSVDIGARVLADGLREKLAQPVIVDNKPAAGGTVAAAEVARATADGYTLYLGFNGPLANAPALFNALPYDPQRDFAAITMTTAQPNVLAVHASVKASNLLELLALARAAPGTLNYASVGNGSASHLSMELLKRAANVDLVHVPFNGGPPAVQAVMAGDVHMILTAPSNVLGQIRAGKLKAIAVTSRTRFAALPEVPTMTEAGIAALRDFEAISWNALVAPRGTPTAVIAQLNVAVRDVLNAPDAQRKLKDAGMEIITGTPESATAWIQREAKKWGEVVRATGARAD